jgi:trigger factor
MSLKSSTKTGANTYELNIEVTGDVFNSAIEKVYNREKKNIQLQGFRKGKAPRKLVEKFYGENVFWEQAINDILNAEIPVAVDAEKLDLVDTPSAEVVSADVNEGVVLKVTCTVKPEITIENYKGIKASKPSDEVTEDDLNAQLESVRKRNARMISIDERPAELNDQVIIDFEGFADGKAFEGGKAENFELGLGSHQFIPGFEEAIVGHSVGEEFEINVTFPEEYGMEELAGKPAVFKIKLHEINSQELPEFNDDFVQEISEFDTVDEYKADAKAKLESNIKNNAQAEFTNNVMTKVIELVQGEIPQCMFDQRVNSLLNDYEQRLKSQGLTMEMYLQYTGMDLDSLKESFMARAKDEVTLRLALEKVAEIEKLEVSDEEVENYIKEIADANKLNVDMVKQFVPVEGIKEDLIVEKASKFIVENAIAEEPSSEEATVTE